MSTPSLRPIDWRFLLAAPAPRRIAFDAAVATVVVTSLRAVGEDVVRLDLAPADRDLVVTCDADARTLEAAHAALRPGGVLYAEWRARRGVRAARAVARAGFRETRTYWRRPGSEDRVWLSADGPAALATALGERVSRRVGAELAWPLHGAAPAAALAVGRGGTRGRATRPSARAPGSGTARSRGRHRAARARRLRAQQGHLGRGRSGWHGYRDREARPHRGRPAGSGARGEQPRRPRLSPTPSAPPGSCSTVRPTTRSARASCRASRWLSDSRPRASGQSRLQSRTGWSVSRRVPGTTAMTARRDRTHHRGVQCAFRLRRS